MTRKTHLVFIHGVGLPGTDLFGTLLQKNIESTGITVDTWTRIDWHQVVEHPFPHSDKGRNAVKHHSENSFPEINLRQICNLTRGIIGCGTLRSPETLGVAACAAIFSLRTLLLISPAFLFCFAIFPATFLASTGISILRIVAFPFLLLHWFIVPAGARQFLFYAAAAYFLIVLAIAAWIPLSCSIRLGRQGFWAGLRHAMALLTWPLLFPILAPFVKMAPIAIFCILSLSVWAVIFDFDTSIGIEESRIPLWADGTPQIPADLTWLTPVIGATHLVPMILFFGVVIYLAKFAELLFKILADVACFMGDQRYRESLLNHVDISLNSLNVLPDDLIVFVCHSLGTAIGAEYLSSNAGTLPKSSSVIFVTMGSPLRRLLSRFFWKCWLLPEEIAEMLQARYRKFAWVNVYRPFDPIGGALFGHATPSTLDVCSGQKELRWLSAHKGYWDDSLIARMTTDAVTLLLKEDVRCPPPGLAIASVFRGQPEEAIHESIDSTAGYLSLFFAVLAAVSVSFNIWFSTTSLRNRQLALDGVRESRVACGDVNATLYGYQEIVPGEVPMVVPRYLVVFRPDGSTRDVAFSADIADVSDLAARTLKIQGANTELYRKYSVWDTPAKKMSVRLRYSVLDPSLFFIVDYPVDFGSVAVKDISVRVFLIVFVSGLVVLVMFVSAKFYFGIMLGSIRLISKLMDSLCL